MQLTIVALLSCQPAYAQHVHGAIELGIVVENDELFATVHAPMNDVVGFEYEPRTDEQRERVERAAELLANADAMIGTPEAAACKAESVMLEAPDFIVQHTDESEADEHEHGP